MLENQVMIGSFNGPLLKCCPMILYLFDFYLRSDVNFFNQLTEIIGLYNEAFYEIY